jgi:pimeloyl-ACP methyl ester carboxylesterase
MHLDPFRVEVGQLQIDDLRERLAKTRWPESEDGGGVDRARLKTIIAKWREFDIDAMTARLNAFDQFTAIIGDRRQHFVHVRSSRESAPPVLLLNGWPASFAELLPLVERLTDGDPAFHVVIPSLPGYGFSGAMKDGWDPFKAAEEMIALMGALGYDRFGVHASDVGAGIALALALDHAAQVERLHLLNVYYDYPPVEDASKDVKDWLERAQAWFMSDGAYAHVQMTRPRSLDVGLTDSPAGLAAWILEKFQDWSDNGLDAFDDEALLTNLTIYWLTGTIGSSFAPYMAGRDIGKKLARRVEVPTGVLITPGDILPAPRAWGERWLNLVRWTEAERGGHFPALDIPHVLAEEIRATLAAR